MNFLNYPLNVVIPAGASGIGESIARAYIEQGCNVFVCDVSNHNINLFREKYPEAYVEQVDVSDHLQVAHFFTNLSTKIDHVDVIVNCAGIAGPTAKLVDIEPSEWDETISVNLNGMFYILKHGISFLKKSSLILILLWLKEMKIRITTISLAAKIFTSLAQLSLTKDLI